ncbi:MAG: hypothetical protein K8R77_12345 [Anaerolineaceae bacterium]|nr:hypothetical protein [Anaerolineaceae bacterium]
MAAYDISEEKCFLQPEEQVFQAVLGAIAGLEGKVIEQDDSERKIKAYFPKTILGNTLGDRTHLLIDCLLDAEGTKISVLGYPVDAVQRKLMFGVRKGVTRKVITWFWAHVDHRLK